MHRNILFKSSLFILTGFFLFCKGTGELFAKEPESSIRHEHTSLILGFQNDILTYNNSDRYFTNGISIDLQSIKLGRLPLRKLMYPLRGQGYRTYDLILLQDMYTPADMRKAPALTHDRPYASYLITGYRQTYIDPVRRLRISTQLDLGYLGPYSPGSYLQTFVHEKFPSNDVPVGWETQIGTDLILNYGLEIQHAFITQKYVNLQTFADIHTGTLYDNAGVGFGIQAGKSGSGFECLFIGKVHTAYVAYNALLQGGMFNSNQEYTLGGKNICRVIGSAEFGVRMFYKDFGFEIAQHYLTPEFKTGQSHRWGRISLIIQL